MRLAYSSPVPEPPTSAESWVNHMIWWSLFSSTVSTLLLQIGVSREKEIQYIRLFSRHGFCVPLLASFTNGLVMQLSAGKALDGEGVVHLMIDPHFSRYISNDRPSLLWVSNDRPSLLQVSNDRPSLLQVSDDRPSLLQVSNRLLIDPHFSR